MKTNSSLYKIFKTKIKYSSSKWTNYLDIYQKIFDEIKNRKNLNILEIGVQNGGSLEAYSRFFSNKTKIYGVDINPKCKKLKFSKNIKVFTGRTDKIFKQIKNEKKLFDLIIDDGSHSSDDTIKNFFNYLPLLKKNGFFVVEDLHASYWSNFGGGLFKKDSSINFFKNIFDTINHPNWKSKFAFLFKNYNYKYKKFLNQKFFKKLTLIKSLEIFNSIIIIKCEKHRNPKYINFGKIYDVATSHKKMNNKDIVALLKENKVNFKSESDKFKKIYYEQKKINEELLNSTSWKITKPLRNIKKKFLWY